MIRRAMASIAAKFSLATLLLAFSIAASTATMRCLMGLPMEQPAKAASMTPMKADHSCCAPKAKAPEPAKPRSKCCCIDVMKKNLVDFGQGKIIEFPLEFPILIPPTSSFECSQAPVPVQQVRWPEVHGPPGVARGPASSRAPPAA